MRLSLFLLLMSELWLTSAAERDLPAQVQVDLIFPRNETYAPTQYFPIVFGIKNLDAAWPFDMSLAAELKFDVNFGSEITWETQPWSLGYEDFVLTAGPDPGKYFYHIVGTSRFNNTRDGHHMISWGIGVQNRCSANNTDPKLDVKGNQWLSWTGGDPYQLYFSTASDGQLPDIEAAAESCSEPSRNSSKAIQINEMRETSDWERMDYDHWKNWVPDTTWDRKGFFDNSGGKWCLAMDTNVPSEKCSHKALGQEIAANVSKEMLGLMSCEEGEWQTIRVPCSASHMTTLGSLRWGAALLSLAWWIL